jgi:hypothetical protein
MRAPLARAEISPETRFVAEPRALATLIAADATGDPPRLTGVGAIHLDPEGPTRDPVALPWHDPTALPRLALSGATWIAALDRPGDSAARVLLWRAGALESIGEGDGFEAADLACAGRACALLTSRLARVTQPGATIWVGASDAPASAWKPIEILPAAGESDARPLSIAAISAGAPGDAAAGGLRVTAAIVDKGNVVFYGVDDAGAREEARVPLAHGVLDALAVPAPVVLASAVAVDDDGCPRDGRPGLQLASAGKPPILLPAPAPPIRGNLRHLQRGAIALWIAPLGCKQPRRVVYGVVLDAQGAPVGAPITVGDAAAFATASSGDDVDLYLQDPTGVTWVRMSCTAP